MEDFKRSESIKNIATSLVEFKKKVSDIKKTKENPFFHAKYADLSDVLDAIDPALIESQLSLVSLPYGKNELIVILSHTSGEFIQTKFNTCAIPEYLKEKDKTGKVEWRASEPHTTPQSFGSALTYARRYAILAVLNLAVIDDDGNAGSGKGPKEEDTRPFLNKTKLGSAEVLPEFKEAVEIAKKEGNLDSLIAKYRMTKATQEAIATEADI